MVENSNAIKQVSNSKNVYWLKSLLLELIYTCTTYIDQIHTLMKDYY